MWTGTYTVYTDAMRSSYTRSKSKSRSRSRRRRCVDGVLPRSRYQKSALYITADEDDGVDGEQNTRQLSPAASRRRSPPPPPPPPPPASSRATAHSPRCSPADGCLLRRTADLANHVDTPITCPPRTTPASAADVWVQLTTH